MFKITVVRRGTPRSVYIGRGSIFGNPFKEGTRDENCDAYQEYFDKRVKEDEAFKEALRQLWRRGKQKGELKLACFCAPKRCHGDTIKAFLEKHF